MDTSVARLVLMYFICILVSLVLGMAWTHKEYTPLFCVWEGWGVIDLESVHPIIGKCSIPTE